MKTNQTIRLVQMKMLRTSQLPTPSKDDYDQDDKRRHRKQQIKYHPAAVIHGSSGVDVRFIVSIVRVSDDPSWKMPKVLFDDRWNRGQLAWRRERRHCPHDRGEGLRIVRRGDREEGDGRMKAENVPQSMSCCLMRVRNPVTPGCSMGT